ncbi:hypothetical protein thsps21_60570 [Pseudomonas sp. No.21]|nr:hypothetical protein TUM20249_62270 [Pseudomonas tohonis]
MRCPLQFRNLRYRASGCGSGCCLFVLRWGGGWFFGWLKAQWQKSLDAFGGLPSVYLF